MLFGLVSARASETIFDHRCYTYLIGSKYYGKRKAIMFHLIKFVNAGRIEHVRCVEEIKQCGVRVW